MSETVQTAPNIERLRVGSSYEIMTTLAQRVDFELAENAPESALRYTVLNAETPEEHFEPYGVLASSLPEGFVTDDAIDADKQTELLDAAARTIKIDRSVLGQIANNAGYWWVTTSPHDKNRDVESMVDTDLLEGFRVYGVDDQFIDILNCSETALTEEAIAALQTTLQNSAQLSGGQIFDTVRGIVITKQGGIKTSLHRDPLGQARKQSGVVLIDETVLRPKLAEKHPSFARYNPYFAIKHDEYDALKVVLSHELGHMVDATPIESRLQRGGIVADEEHPTWYAEKNNSEDFAESFAIMAMEGDVTQLPLRSRRVLQVIHDAAGQQVHGPYLCEVERITSAEQFAPDGVSVGIHLGYRPHTAESSTAA